MTAALLASLVIEADPPGLPVGHLPLSFGGVPERMVAAGLLAKREVHHDHTSTWYLAPPAPPS